MINQEPQNSLHRLWADESGQATTEYILILSVTVSLAVVVMKTFIRPTFTKLMEGVSSKIEQQFLRADLHTYPIR